MRKPSSLSGDLVYEAILDHPGIPNKHEIANATGLSINQVSVGIIWIKEVAAYENKTPFTWTYRDGYHLNPDFEMCHSYEKHSSFGNYTRIKRELMGTYAPHAALDPRDEWLHKMTRIYETFLDDVAGQLKLPPLSWPLPIDALTPRSRAKNTVENETARS